MVGSTHWLCEERVWMVLMLTERCEERVWMVWIIRELCEARRGMVARMAAAERERARRGASTSWRCA